MGKMRGGSIERGRGENKWKEADSGESKEEPVTAKAKGNIGGTD